MTGFPPRRLCTRSPTRSRKVNTISGLTRSVHVLRRRFAVVVNFTLEKNMTSPQEVRDRVNNAPLLLHGRSRRSARDPTPPSADYGAHGHRCAIRRRADKVLRRRLESADGVGQVLVLAAGGRSQADRGAQGAELNDVTQPAQNADVLRRSTRAPSRSRANARPRRSPRRRYRVKSAVPSDAQAAVEGGMARRRHAGARQRRSDRSAADPGSRAPARSIVTAVKERSNSGGISAGYTPIVRDRRVHRA